MDSLLFWKIVLVIAVLPGTAIAVWATIKIYNINEEKGRIEKAISRTSGTIKPPEVDETLSKEVSLLFGTNKSSIPKGNITGGKSYGPLSAYGSDLPLTFTIDKKGALLVNAKYRDFDGNIVAEINNNEWVINHNNYFKRNYDSTGFEVIDKDGITKFQIEFINNKIIKIGGVFRDSCNWWFVSDSRTSVFDVRFMKKEEIIKESTKVPDLFRYPSEKYLGIRNKAQEN
jgi:hypothetical protein